MLSKYLSCKNDAVYYYKQRIQLRNNTFIYFVV